MTFSQQFFSEKQAHQILTYHIQGGKVRQAVARRPYSEINRRTDVDGQPVGGQRGSGQGGTLQTNVHRGS